MRKYVPVLMTGVVIIGLSVVAPSVQAVSHTNPSVSPSSVGVGSASALTFEYNVAGQYARVATGVGVQGFSVVDEFVTPVLSGTRVTCSFASGIVATWESTGFGPGAGGSNRAGCDSYNWNDGYNYFELALGDDIALNGGRVTLEISAGGFVAPSVAGNFGFQTYVWNGSYLERAFGSISVGQSAGVGQSAVAEPPQWLIVRQGLPMPESGSCDAVTDADFAWGTGLTGGWRKSWEPWVKTKEDLGGWACVRALVNKGGDKWSVENSVL